MLRFYTVISVQPKIAPRSDYHIHTPLCLHATGSPTEMAAAAVDLGLEEIGFADHAPMARDFDDWRMKIDQLPQYLDEVEAARQAFPQLTIRLGLECDYLIGHESWIDDLASRANWDFLIGSVHYLPQGWEVDHPKYLNRHRGHADEIWAGYWAMLERAIRTSLFDFIGHPDLPKKFGFRPTGDLSRFYEPVIAALAETGVAFEINTAGLRKECAELYPSQEFLNLAYEAGVPLCINSDAHAPGEIGSGFAKAVEAARAAGYTEVLRFKGRTRRAVAL